MLEHRASLLFKCPSAYEKVQLVFRRFTKKEIIFYSKKDYYSLDCITYEIIRHKYFSGMNPLFFINRRKMIFSNFLRRFNRRKNEKDAPVGITCQTFRAPRGGEVEVWYKIPRCRESDLNTRLLV
jgi:hypothetical protein